MGGQGLCCGSCPDVPARPCAQSHRCSAPIRQSGAWAWAQSQGPADPSGLLGTGGPTRVWDGGCFIWWLGRCAHTCCPGRACVMVQGTPQPPDGPGLPTSPVPRPSSVCTRLPPVLHLTLCPSDSVLGAPGLSRPRLLLRPGLPPSLNGTGLLETAGAVARSWPLDKGGGLLGRCLSPAGTSLMSTSCSPGTAQTSSADIEVE